MKAIFKSSLFIIILLTIGSGYAYWKYLDNTINQALEQGWFRPFLQYYSAPQTLLSDQKYSFKKLKVEFIKRHYLQEKSINQLNSGEYVILKNNECQKMTSSDQVFKSCVVFKTKAPSVAVQALGFKKDGTISVYRDLPFRKASSIDLDPILFAGSEDGTPLLRKRFKLNQVPYECLQSITLIEDHEFLLHTGVSIKGVLRAFVKNISSGRFKEGGSTITQQLIKNRFLSFEKTLKRKWTEWIMALILESKISKDRVLELYLNTIYMGKGNLYNIYGFESAANFYFNKPLKQINASECALLSSMVQSPGRMNPFKNAKRAKKRRNYILKKMYNKKVISRAQFKKFIKQALPKNTSVTASAPYFIDAVYKEIKNKKISMDKNLKIYTTIDLSKQEKAEKSIKQVLYRLDKRTKSNKKLEVSLIHVDLKTNNILTLIGGRRSLHYSFNRSIDAHRPIGSLMKPIVYLSALLKNKELDPSSLVLDKPYKYKSWSPKNYKNRYYGKIPLYFALSNSLNTVSARLGKRIGLTNILYNFKKLGSNTKLSAVPSVTLGAVDISPKEITQVYSSIARMGSHKKLSLINLITKEDGSLVYKNSLRESQRIDKNTVAVLIGMMKQVVQTGTASWIRPFWPIPTGGKTGTSNEERDSWFIGFTPDYLTSVWIGYDDNTPHGLTGASGALALWLAFMKSIDVPNQDFSWPKGTVIKTFKPPVVTQIKKRKRGKSFFKVQMDKTPLNSQSTHSSFYTQFLHSLFGPEKLTKDKEKTKNKSKQIDLIFDTQKKQSWFNWL